MAHLRGNRAVLMILAQSSEGMFSKLITVVPLKKGAPCIQALGPINL
jgi:hypothetical protein